MKTALVFGSSGLIGGHLLYQLIKNDNYNKIKLFVRSETSINGPKQNSPDKNEYQKVELEIPKKIAEIAKANLVNSFIFISSIYANPKSSGDYVKFKGLVEEELKKLNFSNLGILRPSFLMGDRKENRVGEKIGVLTFRLLSPLLLGPLKKMRPINSEKVAKAMIKIANENLGKTIFESDEIVEITSR